VLAHIKAEQDKAAASAEVHPESARNGYRKNGRRNNGWNTLADRKRNADRKASQGCDN
jgi:flagellar biosynthesis chaperone FliJ